MRDGRREDRRGRGRESPGAGVGVEKEIGEGERLGGQRGEGGLGYLTLL